MCYFFKQKHDLLFKLHPTKLCLVSQDWRVLGRLTAPLYCSFRKQNIQDPPSIPETIIVHPVGHCFCSVVCVPCNRSATTDKVPRLKPSEMTLWSFLLLNFKEDDIFPVSLLFSYLLKLSYISTKSLFNF